MESKLDGLNVDKQVSQSSKQSGSSKNKKRERSYLDVQITNFFLKEKSYHFLIQLQKKVMVIEAGQPVR